MDLFLTGGSGVLGRALEPLAGPAGHILRAPSHRELGLLDGPGTGHGRLYDVYGTTLHVADAASALLAALDVPSGIYNVCRDGERISNARLKRASGWRPRR